MVSGRRAVGVLLGAALCACSSNGPLGSSDSTDRAPIVGGATDSNDKFVFGILINNMALCTGSLIAPNLILTARHCVAPINGGEESVNCDTDTFGQNYSPGGFLVTSNTVVNDSSSSQLIGATAVRTPADNDFCGNDIALLILESNVPTSTTPTIAPRIDAQPVTNDAFRAVGYGLNSPNDVQGTSAGTRRGIGNLEVGCVGTDECGSDIIHDTEWAANSPICSGDSGGPALDSQNRVIGIASRSDQDCGIGLYSTVASWKDLIVEAGQDAADQGGYEPPSWVTGIPPVNTGGASSGGASSGGSSSGSAGKAGASGAGGTNGGTGGTSAMGGSSNAGTGGSAMGGTSNAGAAGRSAGSGGRSGSAGTTGKAGDGNVSLPDAGAPDPTSGGSLGDECTSGCDAPYVCYTATGNPPGTCVPACSTTIKCPANYRCSVELGACAPLADGPDAGSSSNSKDDDDDDSPKSDSGCGCRVTPVSDATGSAWHALGALALATAAARRRRRSSRA